MERVERVERVEEWREWRSGVAAVTGPPGSGQWSESDRRIETKAEFWSIDKRSTMLSTLDRRDSEKVPGTHVMSTAHNLAKR